LKQGLNPDFCYRNLKNLDFSAVRNDVKFKKFNLTPEQASQVNVPMINECYANLECKVIDTKMVAKYNFFVLEVVKAWIHPSKKRQRTIHHCGYGVFIVDGKIIKLRSHKK